MFGFRIFSALMLSMFAMGAAAQEQSEDYTVQDLVAALLASGVEPQDAHPEATLEAEDDCPGCVDAGQDRAFILTPLRLPETIVTFGDQAPVTRANDVTASAASAQTSSTNRPRATPARRSASATRRAPTLPGSVTIEGNNVDLMLRFYGGSARLTTTALGNVRKVADALSEPQLMGRRLRIEGHASADGSDTLNMDLSAQRAEATKAALIEFGVAADRIEAIGLGENAPISGISPYDARNRRIEAGLIIE